jgi:hypothetical protein
VTGSTHNPTMTAASLPTPASSAPVNLVREFSSITGNKRNRSEAQGSVIVDLSEDSSTLRSQQLCKRGKIEEPDV